MNGKADTSWSLAFSLARRELRGGLKGFRIFFACLVLGVSAIAGIGSLTQSLEQGLEAQGQSLLGGDVEVRTLRRAATADELEYISNMGVMTKSLSHSGLVRSIKTDRRTLGQIKSIEDIYPLYGELKIEPQIDVKSLLEEKNGIWGVAIPPNLADRLRIGLGDILLIGDGEFEVRALLMYEPDRQNASFQWGPTVLTSWDAIATMNLIKPGSLYQYFYKVKLPQGGQSDEGLEQAITGLEEAFPDNNWRIRDRTNSAPGVRTMVDRMGMFLSLVALSALVVGGVGVGGAVKNYLEGKTKTIATFKILGATGDLIFRIYLIQVMVLAALAVAVGLLVGSFFPVIISGFLPTDIPVSAGGGLYLTPLFMALAYGFFITLAFTIWPLAKSQHIPAAKLFRSMIRPSKKWPAPRYIIMVVLSSLAVVVMAIGFTEPISLAAGFVAASAISLLLLKLLGFLVERLAAKLPRPKNPLLRLALSNMHRPSAATGAVVMSLGLGFTVFATIALVEGNLSRQVEEQLPGDAPAFFMIDIQKHQKLAFEETVASLKGVNELRMVPSMRGKLTHIAGVPVEDVDIRQDVRWVVNGDRSLTYAPTIPSGNEVSSGAWWPEDYSGEPLISFSANEAEGLGIDVGDVLTVTVLGREINAKVANLRTFEWGTTSFNFVMVFSPGILENAPHYYMASLKIDPEQEATAHRELTDSFPNVTAVRVKEVLETINGILNQISAAI
ncbi:MAG: ABC transporter permease, partial [Sphingomonadales bacterium]|nr:ABC transporter permease [Sphingomonadales bacterium]